MVATNERQITNLSHFSNTRTIQIFRQTMSTRQLINTLLILMLPIYLIGQRQNDIWLFGLGAGLDFSSGSPVKIENAKMFSKEGCAVISDDNGQLLFYTNGIEIFNKNHKLMENGDSFLGTSRRICQTEDDNFETAKISFSAAADSINTGNSDRDKHLQSGDFFDAERGHQRQSNGATCQ